MTTVTPTQSGGTNVTGAAGSVLGNVAEQKDMFLKLLVAQLKGIVAVGVYTMVVSAIFWLAIKYTIGLRVSKEEEIEGLDIGEHGQEAYVGFAPKLSARPTAEVA